VLNFFEAILDPSTIIAEDMAITEETKKAAEVAVHRAELLLGSGEFAEMAALCRFLRWGDRTSRFDKGGEIWSWRCNCAKMR
jgi:hypothetical protein